MLSFPECTATKVQQLGVRTYSSKILESVNRWSISKHCAPSGGCQESLQHFLRSCETLPVSWIYFRDCSQFCGCGECVLEKKRITVNALVSRIAQLWLVIDSRTFHAVQLSLGHWVPSVKLSLPVLEALHGTSFTLQSYGLCVIFNYWLEP